jgi:2-iminobutanoate/2-iminopropanoate deaminase
MVEIHNIASAHAPQAIGPYSQAVTAGGFLFASGQIPLDPASMKVVEGDIKVQTERVLQNIAAVLEAGGSSFRRVVKTTVFLSSMDDFAGMNDVYAQAFGDHRPARSTVAVKALPKGVLVEIDVIAQA